MAKDTSLFVKKLAHNDDHVRRQAFEALKQFVQSKSAASLAQSDYDKLWKGLYFSMWYCDKPLPQQKLAHDLGTLFSVHVRQSSLRLFHTAFWRILAREWYSIDKWRLDKYLMLVRRVVRHMLFRLQAHAWPPAEIQEFHDVMFSQIFSNDPKVPAALGYHVCDLFLDEIEYVVLKDLRDYSEEIDEDDESDESDESDASDGEKDGDGEDNSEAGDGDGDGEDMHQKPDDLSNSPASKDAEAKAKAKALSEAPVSSLVQPFRTLAETAQTEAMRKKCREEIFGDGRLIQWGVLDAPEKEEEEEEEEWTGF